jgi:hypothetical protein
VSSATRGSYVSFARQIRLAGLRPHCEACAGVRGRETIEIEHPPGEETQWDWRSNGFGRQDPLSPVQRYRRLVRLPGDQMLGGQFVDRARIATRYHGDYLWKIRWG